MVWQPPAQQVALGVGVNGALVDVSSFIVGPEGTTYSWGRQSEFRDPNPGQVVFVLENQDGRFTPGNTGSPLATPLTEGAAVCWSIGGRLVGATVSGISFASSETEWGRVTITASDVFYVANRTQLSDLARAIGSIGSYLYWPLNDAAGSAQALEMSGNQGPSLVLDPILTPMLTMGVSSTGPSSDTQATLANSASVVQYFKTVTGFPLISYPAGSYGAWGMWVTPQTAVFNVELDVFLANGAEHQLTVVNNGLGLGTTVQFTSTLGTSGSAALATVPWSSGAAHYISAVITYSGTAFTLTLYVDGVAVATGTRTATGVTNAGMQPTTVRVSIGDGSTFSTVSLAHISHTSAYRDEWSAGATTEAAKFAAVMQTIPGVQIGSIDANLSTAQVDQSTTSNVAAWAVLCDLARTEQGHIYTSTAGPLLSPTTTVNFRARTRPSTVTLTLDAALDLDGVPPFDRDITNLFGVVSATGPTQSVTVTDAAAIARVGNASTSETVDLANYTDLLGYAQDRMQRGKNVALKVQQVVVNTVTSTVTLAQLLALTPGDRIRVTNLPSGPLGFTQWDGWFLGADEVHNYLGDVFTLYMAPVLPATGVYDTDLFSAGTDLSLNASITSGATSFVVATANTLTFLETVQVPYTLQIDQEQVTVTACTALSGTTQTVTVTRGANGTTAAAHNAGALVDLANAPIYAF